jgi:SOS-response transcriptional repressor LexA
MTSKYIETVYQYIISFKVDHDGNSPTIREIASGCTISSISQVQYYLDRLVDDGRIEMSEGIGRRKIIVKGGCWRLREHTNLT